MRKKLIVLFTLLTFCLCALIGRLMYINYTSGEKYEKKVLSMQSYDSVTIPYQRGDIIDRNGTVLATSVAVYNVILDCSVMTSTTTVNGEKTQKYIEPTIEALVECFPELNKGVLYQYATEKPDSKYIILLKKLPYDQIQPFVKLQEEVDEDGKKVNPNIKGVWFEKEYIRSYPFNELASSVIGFVSSGNVGTIGLENYYNDTLNGINGREYGYLNSESDFEKTVIAPEDGNTLVTTIDANIQSVVERKIKEFNSAYTNNYRDGAGSLTTAVIVMNPNNGAVLAMAEYPTFDLNKPRDVSNLYTEEELELVTTEEQMDALNQLWRNFCVSETYEPGSVQKPFTIACGLETGKLNTNMTFECDGGAHIAGGFIGCVNLHGHGTETLEKSLMDSCNDALMQMADVIGKEEFVKYQSVFGYGQKTGIDLPGEANTSTLVYSEEDMKAIDLATNSFGQNYNTTMIQVASAFSSIVNGGTYYQPYLVSKVVAADGGTISVTEPTVLKQTVSESTSELLKSYMYSTVTSGTGSTAKVDGYSLGGKTGTAEKYPRNQGNYLVSFIGFAPYENPELVIYCIVDEPNSKDQPHSYYAQN
ncbi:MAG: peptidoglycan glycosyltransferase, partial [Agathobacter sp.]|nr:peptidoglycan glycosyltransferase [Agathobacter sp.]